MAFHDYLLSLSGRSFDSLDRRRTTSAMTPVTWFVSVAAGLCFGSAYAFRDKPDICGPLVVVGVLVVVAGGGVLLYFAFRDPDRLQTEEHLVTARTLDLIASKGGRIAVRPVDLPAVAGQAPPRALSQGPSADEPPEAEADG